MTDDGRSGQGEAKSEGKSEVESEEKKTPRVLQWHGREPMTGRTADTRSNPRRRKHHGSYDGVGRDADRDTGGREPRPTKRGSDFLKQQRGSLDPTLERRHREAHPAGEAWGHQDPEYWQCNKMRLRDNAASAHVRIFHFPGT